MKQLYTTLWLSLLAPFTPAHAAEVEGEKKIDLAVTNCSTDSLASAEADLTRFAGDTVTQGEEKQMVAVIAKVNAVNNVNPGKEKVTGSKYIWAFYGMLVSFKSGTFEENEKEIRAEIGGYIKQSVEKKQILLNIDTGKLEKSSLSEGEFIFAYKDNPKELGSMPLYETDSTCTVQLAQKGSFKKK